MLLSYFKQNQVLYNMHQLYSYQSNNGSCLEDVWLIDLSKVDDANAEIESLEDEATSKKPPAKGKGKSEVVDDHPHACMWIRLEVPTRFSEIFARSMHLSCRLDTLVRNESGIDEDLDNVQTIGLFNGFGKYGLPYTAAYSVKIDIASHSVIDCMTLAVDEDSICLPGTNLARYIRLAKDLMFIVLKNIYVFTVTPGSISLIVKNQNGSAALISSQFKESMHYIILGQDETNNQVALTLLEKSKSIEQERLENQEIERIERANINPPTSLEYDSGDRYEGDMRRDVSFGEDGTEMLGSIQSRFLRHGEGKMVYANETVYQGTWMNRVFTYIYVYACMHVCMYLCACMCVPTSVHHCVSFCVLVSACMFAGCFVSFLHIQQNLPIM